MPMKLIHFLKRVFPLFLKSIKHYDEERNFATEQCSNYNGKTENNTIDFQSTTGYETRYLNCSTKCVVLAFPIRWKIHLKMSFYDTTVTREFICW